MLFWTRAIQRGMFWSGGAALWATKPSGIEGLLARTIIPERTVGPAETKTRRDARKTNWMVIILASERRWDEVSTEGMMSDGFPLYVISYAVSQLRARTITKEHAEYAFQIPQVSWLGYESNPASAPVTSIQALVRSARMVCTCQANCNTKLHRSVYQMTLLLWRRVPPLRLLHSPASVNVHFPTNAKWKPQIWL